ncbi:hypothetical protein ASE70_10290 [Sphingomonas sp. Leaf22]|uniref:TonB-dependent receptor plug domain-containing protein n=1 Tax=Sphingomonas sp. Leaf22 TaxID=1735687 RepID=UPI0006F673AA|nr:TonB-dependent receptor plug domain-containing protein [Sphingomonas sp. Leaf22]KQM76174.1 hypothetical protein ASE70_10290 [Sphingomonas sp. Leaf22]
MTITIQRRAGLLASAIFIAVPATAQTVAGDPGGQAGAAMATAQPDVEPQNDIIVTGQRRLSRAPQDAKRSSLAMVDSVGALEIQKLPDQTIADALARVPGVSLQRGFQFQKGWYATIRGLDSNYNSVDLDGGMFFDSTRNDRAVYLDTVPAMAINELVVTKTVTPDMDANSIGWHLSINTLRAFDLGGAAVTKGDFGLNLFDKGGAPDRHGPGKIGNLVVKRTFGADGDFGFVGAASWHDDRYSQTYNNTSAYIVRAGSTCRPARSSAAISTFTTRATACSASWKRARPIASMASSRAPISTATSSRTIIAAEPRSTRPM